MMIKTGQNVTKLHVLVLKLSKKNYHLTNQYPCGSNYKPKYMLFKYFLNFLQMNGQVFYFTIQGHCGNVKGQTMLSTHQFSI